MHLEPVHDSRSNQNDPHSPSGFQVPCHAKHTLSPPHYTGNYLGSFYFEDREDGLWWHFPPEKSWDLSSCGCHLPSAISFHSLTQLCLSILSLFILLAPLNLTAGNASAIRPASLLFFTWCPWPWDAPSSSPYAHLHFLKSRPSCGSRSLQNPPTSCPSGSEVMPVTWWSVLVWLEIEATECKEKTFK